MFSLINERALINFDEVQKFHNSLESFDSEGIRETIRRIKFNLGNVSKTAHFEQRCAEKEVPVLSVWKILTFGKCFEYKTHKGFLYRFAIRVSGTYKKDFIYVFEPRILRDGKIGIRFVTAYANNKWDAHKILKKENYASR